MDQLPAIRVLGFRIVMAHHLGTLNTAQICLGELSKIFKLEASDTRYIFVQNMVKKRRKTLVHHYYCSSSSIALSCRQRHNFAIRFRKSIPTPSIGEIFFLGFLFFLLAILVLPMSATENKRVKCAIYYLGGTIYFTLTQFFFLPLLSAFLTPQEA